MVLQSHLAISETRGEQTNISDSVHPTDLITNPIPSNLLQERGVSLVHRSGGECGLREKYELMYKFVQKNGY